MSTSDPKQPRPDPLARLEHRSGHLRKAIVAGVRHVAASLEGGELERLADDTTALLRKYAPVEASPSDDRAKE